MVEQPFEIELCEEPTRIRIVVRGDLVLGTAPDLRLALSSLAGRAALLDLTEVPFTDSTGIATIVRACIRGEARLRVLRTLHPQVERALAIAGVLDVLPLCDG